MGGMSKETKHQQAVQYAEGIPYCQDRKQHAAEDFAAGWDAAFGYMASITLDRVLEELETFLRKIKRDDNFSHFLK